MNHKVRTIYHYKFEQPLTNENGGFSMWGLGTHDGMTYFVKEFLKPVYPISQNGKTNGAKLATGIKCNEFVRKKTKLYQAIHEAADGNIVEIQQFFRSGTKYYISTEAITERVLTIEEIAALKYEKRLLLCCQIAYSFSRLHRQGVVHADVKPSNVLVINEAHPRGKIIDFDAGFLLSDPPTMEEELNGDFVYMSPEACLHMNHIASNLTCKMDVFALAILFHQYLTGRIPSFDTGQYDGLYEVALEGAEFTLDASLPPTISKLLRSMLDLLPELRPDSEKVYQTLRTEVLELYGRTPVAAADTGKKDTASDGRMHLAGEL